MHKQVCVGGKHIHDGSLGSSRESWLSFKHGSDTVRFVFSCRAFFVRGCDHVTVTDHFHPLVETLSCPTYVTIFLQSQIVLPELFSIVIICDLHYCPVFIYFLQNRLPVNFYSVYLDSLGHI